MSLSTYRTELRRLLHDSSGRVWSDAQLNDYINDGRRQVAVDTHCLRAVETITIPVSVETMVPATAMSKGARVVDIRNITLLWGSSRVPMLWYAWTNFNAKYRIWQVNEGRPCVWAFLGTSPATQVIYFQPVPDQGYDIEIDYFYIPVALVDDTTVDELAYPFTKPVAYYAAAMAKENQQGYGEMKTYMQQYAMKAMECINAFTARYENPYR